MKQPLWRVSRACARRIAVCRAAAGALLVAFAAAWAPPAAAAEVRTVVGDQVAEVSDLSDLGIEVVDDRAQLTLDNAITAAPLSTAVSRKLSTGTSTPRSTTSNPAPSIIIATRFLPMSC